MKIYTWPADSKMLRQVSQPVETPDEQLVADMFNAMYMAGGVGLAAIQVGIPKRLFVMGVGRMELAFYNPVVVERLGKAAPVEEGCLSLPGIYEKVKRFPAVVVEHGFSGNRRREQFGGLAAQVIEHETEHLDGVLLPDHFSELKRGMMRKKLSK